MLVFSPYTLIYNYYSIIPNLVDKSIYLNVMTKIHLFPFYT